MIMKRIICILMCGIILLQFSSCSFSDNTEATKNITAMNTVMQITVFNTEKGTSEEVLNLMVERVGEIEKLFDANSPDSDVSKINQFPGTPSDETASEEDKLFLHEETIDVLIASNGAYYGTDFAFNINLMPVLKLWGFDNGNYGVPDDDAVKNALATVDESSILIYETEKYIVKSEGTQISLGGIAKGYLGDELLEIAEEYGATALVSLGGNIVLCGDKGDNKKWTVGVTNPDDTGSLACSFRCNGNRSVVTSGAYERYFEYGGKSYHHIIDPATGFPADSDLLSVTVVGENGTMCDAYSTALFVMGKEKAVEFAKEHNDYDFILITKDKEIITTEGVTDVVLEDDGFSLVKSVQQ